MIITWKIAAVSLKHILEITPHTHAHTEGANSLIRQLPTYDFLLKKLYFKGIDLL